MGVLPKQPITLVERILWLRDFPGVRARVLRDADQRLWWCEMVGGIESSWSPVDQNPPPWPVHAESF